jgi:hypothetical protein
MSWTATAEVRCCSAVEDVSTMSRTTAILVAACLLGGAASAGAAPRNHRSAAARWTARRHASTRMHAPAHPFPGYSAPYAYGFRPFSGAEERWFDQAKGNIW